MLTLDPKSCRYGPVENLFKELWVVSPGSESDPGYGTQQARLNKTWLYKIKDGSIKLLGWIDVEK